MNLPFSTEEFLNVFRLYNETFFPVQGLFIIAAAVIAALIIKKGISTSRIINLLLSFFWLWTGIVYHIIFFSEINPAAYIFGAFFIIQGLLFLIYGTILKKINYGISKSGYNITGFILVLYSLIFYPAVGLLAGHIYPYSPTFGLPCPTVIFTIGILLFTEERIPVQMIIIPFLWSLLGFSAAINLGIYEDTGLVIAGFTGVISYLLQRKTNYHRLKPV